MTSAVPAIPYTSSLIDSTDPTSNSEIIDSISANNLLQDQEFLAGFNCFEQSRDYQLEKVYQFGFLQKKDEAKSKLKASARKWSGWYAELTGLTLTLWPASSPTECLGPRLQTIKKRKPITINIADCNVFTIQFAGNPNAFVLNTQTTNHVVFQTYTITELQSWVLAFRFANIETSLLHEYYTSLIFHSTKHRSLFDSHLSEYNFSGWVELRTLGMKQWTKLWMSVHFNGSEPYITFSPAKHSPDFLLKVTSLHQAYLMYPGHVTLVESSSNLRLEGEIMTTYDPSVQNNNLTFLVLSSASQNEMMRILLTLYHTFQLPTLPNPTTFSPLSVDTKEILSAPVIGVTYKETHLTVLDIWRNKIRAIPTVRSTYRPRERKFVGLPSSRFSAAVNDSRPLSYLSPKVRKSTLLPSNHNKTDSNDYHDKNNFKNQLSLPNTDSQINFSVDELFSSLGKDYFSPTETSNRNSKSDDSTGNSLKNSTENSIENDDRDKFPLTPLAFDEMANLYPEFNEITDFTAQLTLDDPNQLPSPPLPKPETNQKKELEKPRPRVSPSTKPRPFSLVSVFSTKFSKKSTTRNHPSNLKDLPSTTEESCDKESNASPPHPSDSASTDSLLSNPEDDADNTPLGAQYIPCDPTLAYNPALQRPSTLLEVREYAKYKDQLKNQVRVGPLLYLSSHRPASSPKLLPPTPTSNPSQLKTTHMSSRPRLNSDPKSWEPRQPVSIQHRAQVTQSHMYPHELNYMNFGPGHSHNLSSQSYYQHDGPQSARLSGYDFDHHDVDHRRSQVINPLGNPLVSQSQMDLSSRPRVRHGGVTLAARQAQCQSYSGGPLRPSPFSPMASRTMENLIPNYSPPTSRSTQPQQRTSTYEVHRSTDSLPHPSDFKDEASPGLLRSHKPSPSAPVTPPTFAHQPTLIRKKYRDHAASQSALHHPTLNEDRGDAFLNDDQEELFQDFANRHLQSEPSSYLLSSSLYPIFFRYCQTTDCDFQEIPSPSLFITLMHKAGYESQNRRGETWCHLTTVNL